jgi:hypothetical protein
MEDLSTLKGMLGLPEYSTERLAQYMENNNSIGFRLIIISAKGTSVDC